MNEILINLLYKVRPDCTFTTSTILTDVLDSFDVMLLVVEIDREFNISIDGEDIKMKNFEDIESITNLISKKINV